MDRSNLELDFKQLKVPDKVGIPQLQTQFQENYELDETLSQALVMTSCESLRDVLAGVEEILSSDEKEMDYEAIRDIIHRAKGLFLNMGAEQWALYVSSLRMSRKGEVYSNLQTVMENIQKNFNEIIVLCEK